MSKAPQDTTPSPTPEGADQNSPIDPNQACEVTHHEADLGGSAPEDTDLLADHTTLRVGGPAGEFVIARTEDELIDAISHADAEGVPVLILGGGSNLVVGDDGFPGRVVRVATHGISAQIASCSGAHVTVAAGEVWDDFVRHAIEHQWLGTEMLSGIPGLVGSLPIQNVGAYGADASQIVSRVFCWDRQEGQRVSFAASECGFGYRMSRFKADPGRYVILRVQFQLPLGHMSQPIIYPELAKHLGVEIGERAAAADVRAAVIEIRTRKGMVLSSYDHDTWSAGSFFTNPILSEDEAAKLPEDAPRYPTEAGVKTSAAWLIDHAGFGKGYGNEITSLSTRHVLAITNRGTATAADVLALAGEVRDGVHAKFGVWLTPEPNLVGCELP